MLSFGVTTADHSSPFPLLLQQHTPCISSLISFIMNLLLALFYPGLVAPCSAPLCNMPATLLIPSRPSLPPNRPTNAAPLILILNSVIPHHYENCIILGFAVLSSVSLSSPTPPNNTTTHLSFPPILLCLHSLRYLNHNSLCRIMDSVV